MTDVIKTTDVCNYDVCVQDKDGSAPSQPVNRADQYFDQSRVECVIQNCPELLKRGNQSFRSKGFRFSAFIFTFSHESKAL